MKQVKTIRDSNQTFFDKAVNEFLKEVDYKKNDVKLHYRYANGYNVVLIEIEEKQNPLLDYINKK